MPVRDKDASASQPSGSTEPEQRPAQSSVSPRPSGVAEGPPRTASSVTLFICANSARPGIAPTSGRLQRPTPLPVEWPFPAHEVVVPCTGKLQPEHLLKAFEAGADLVCIIACAEENCHYLEGSRRAKRRVEYVRSLLDELGIGGERLMIFHLPGSAREDMAAGCGDHALPPLPDAGPPGPMHLVAIPESMAIKPGDIQQIYNFIKIIKFLIFKADPALRSVFIKNLIETWKINPLLMRRAFTLLVQYRHFYDFMMGLD